MALLIYSSGTTGRPREVMREHSNLDALCHSIIEASLTGDDHGVSILPQPCSYRARRWIPVGRSRYGAGRRAVNPRHRRPSWRPLTQPESTWGAPPADITLLPPFVDGNGTTRRPAEHKGAARSGGGADRAQCALAQEPYSLRTTEPTVFRPSRSRWACAASCRGSACLRLPEWFLPRSL